MKIRNTIRSLTTGALLLIAGFPLHAQFVKTVHSYLPAPGQYTNTEQIGRPAAAQSIVGKLNGLVSLGGFGGYIVLGFEQSIENDPANPYGVDFTIFGNATPTWSEAGIVQVMRDDNGNGLPDDTWYEIAGSDHYFTSTQSNYQITYASPGDGVVADINWADHLGQSGTMRANSFHQQPYYPMSAYFPGVNTQQLTFSGTLLAGNIDVSSATQVIVSRRAFGYADNTKVLSLTENLPDNPYTAEIEGSGGDAFDISWARDAIGNYVELDKIDFIRIYTGMNAIAGWLGEVSAEIAGIRDVAPQAVQGTTKMVVMEDLPASIFKNDVLLLKAHSFTKGRPSSETIEWLATPADAVKFENGKLTALKSGTVTLKARLVSDPVIFDEHTLKIISEGNAKIELSSTTVQKNDKLKLTGKIADDTGNPIAGMSGKWVSGDANIFSITEEDGQAYLLALKEGQAWLRFQAKEKPEIRDSVQITVLAESKAKKVFVSVKTFEKTIVPRQSLTVGLYGLNELVDSRKGDYSLQSVPKITVAHAVAEIFKQMQTSGDFRFRDDERGNGQLYIWKVPENDGGSTVLHYGYGGTRESETFRKTWIVKINQQNLVVGFDKIEINNADELLVYQVADNSVQWKITQLTANNDSLKKNEPVEIQRTQLSCNMTADRQALVVSSEAMAGVSIHIEGGETKQTDEFGKASFSFAQSGDFMAVSGTDKLKFHVKGTTGIFHPKQQQLTVSPNPATRHIRVNSDIQEGKIELFDLSGRTMLQEEHQNGAPVDVSFLNPGVYVLRLISGENVLQQKIIKQ
ncbi:MAG: T9SS type A sorting domain-containing protein [Prolixibacteraceae bacterium]|jgi:hypothetical protein|nr:T9SS type A sorting domain-containing protein [Prolixibacteraceae bacterium]